MTTVLFDSEAKEEFLESVQFYGNCRSGLGKPFAVIYSIEPDHIRIIAIAHTKRKPGYWFPKP